MKGYMGFSGILGHEFVGVVESLAAGSVGVGASLIGKRVVGDINLSCAACGVCSVGDDRSRNHCPNRTVLGILAKDGTFAEYLTLPVANLHVVPPGVSDEQAVFVEPLAAACRVVEQGLISNQGIGDGSSSSFSSIAILGDGKLGLMIAEVLGREHTTWRHSLPPSSSVETPPPVLFGKHRHKLNFVADSGVECRLVSELFEGGAQQQQQQQQLGSEGATLKGEFMGKFDVVVDATGSPAGLSLASSLCRPMGTLVLKSTCADGEAFNAAPFVINELRVVGSRCGPFPKALELLAIATNDNNDNDGDGDGNGGGGGGGGGGGDVSGKGTAVSKAASSTGWLAGPLGGGSLATAGGACCGVLLVGTVLLAKRPRSSPSSSTMVRMGALLACAAVTAVAVGAAGCLARLQAGKESSSSSSSSSSSGGGSGSGSGGGGGGGVGGKVLPLRVEKYVTKAFPLARAGEAIRCAAERSTMKVQIVCSES
jgi:threonine dehydrogenase-like Zn-dependent dehydrogenase